MKKIEEKIDREYEILVKEPELGEEVDKKHEHTTATKEINKKSYAAVRKGIDALLKKLEAVSYTHLTLPTIYSV